VPPSALTLTEGTTFVICAGSGDIGENALHGVFVGDTRVCNGLRLSLDGEPIEALAATQTSPFHAVMVGRDRTSTWLVIREHWVGSGLRSDLRVRNLSPSPRPITVTYRVSSDLAGVFDVKDRRPPTNTLLPSVENDRISFRAAAGQQSATIRPSPPASLGTDGTITWETEIPGRGEWSSCLEVAAVRAGQELPLSYRCGTSPDAAAPSARQAEWQAKLPSLTGGLTGLADAVARGAYDIGALRIFDDNHPDEPVPAAGAPWFMTLFGRDSLIASWMALVIDPSLALATVRTLARLQGTRTVAATEEQPGRILHEVRLGGSGSLALDDGKIYYGTADATPLFVMLVAELHRWGVPLAELQSVLPAVDRALEWIEGPGDSDDDGYVEYMRSSPDGLVNQGWKDSWDAIAFADGRLAEGPIALAEVQAYCYAAWHAGARLAAAGGDLELGRRRLDKAERLKENFNRDFWMPRREAYALALDGDKAQVDAIASNMGHCLWAGIVDPNRAGAVSRWLLSPEMASGWGLRTLASSMARYDPLSYHNGSVWPHDTAIAVAGLCRSGRAAEAVELSRGLLAASAATGGEMPELLSGLSRSDAPIPVGYPAACRPQAWASGSPLLVLRSLLGLDPDVPAGRVELHPTFPIGEDTLAFRRMPLAQGLVDVEVNGDTITAEGLPPTVVIERPGRS